MEARPSDEIDLLELLVKFYQLIIKNKFVIIVCLGLGLLGGFALFQKERDEWKANMMISTNLLNQIELEFLFSELEKSREIPGTENLTDHIIHFDFRVRPSGVQQNAIIEIGMDDSASFRNLQTSLIKYLNESDIVEKRRFEKTHFYSQMIKKIDVELSGLENIKKGADNKATILNPSDVYSKSLDLYQKRIEYEQEINDLKSVQIIKSFGVPVAIPHSITKNLLIGFASGFFLAFLFIVIKAFSNYYKQYLKDH